MQTNDIDYSKPLNDDDINKVFSKTNKSSNNKSKGSSPFEFPHISPEAKNFFKSFYNTNVNALNFPIEGLNKLVGSNKFTTIPTAETSSGLSKILGEMSGYLIPDVAILKGLKGLSNVGKLEELTSNLPPLVRKILKNTTAQGITGGLVAPEGERKRSAELSAAVGGGASTLGGGLKSLKYLGLPAAYNKLINLFSESKPFNTGENLTENMLRDVSQNYLDVVNDANKSYRSIFENNKSHLKPEELKNYNEILEKSPEYGKKYLLSHDTLAGFPNENDEKLISLENLHYYKSELGKLINNKIRKGDYEGLDVLKKAQNSISKDLTEGLKKTNQLDAYNTAQKEFKEKVLPFRIRSGNARTSPVENLHNASNILGKGSEKTLDIDNLLSEGEGNNIDKLSKPFIETPGKTNLDRLNLLTRYLNGDKNKAIEYTKHHLFKNAYNSDTDLINSKKFVDIYDKLSSKQKNALFTKEQRDILNALRSAKNKSRKSFTNNILLKSLMLGGLGAAVGHSPEMAGAGFSILPALKYAIPKISATLLPDNEAALAKYINSASKETKNKNVISPLLASLMSTQTRGNQ